jgi:hypothetical protein
MAILPRIVAALAACSAAAALAQTSWPAAQRLAEATLARHPEAAHVVLHVTPPGAPDSDNLVIGSTMGRLGKKADDDDLRIMREVRTETVIAKSGDRFNVSLPLIDAHDQVIGVVAIGFAWKAGDDKALLIATAERIRDELRGEVADARDLFAGAR